MRLRCYKCAKRGCRGLACDCAWKGRNYAEFDATLWATCPTHQDKRPIFRFGRCRHFVDACLERYEGARQEAMTRLRPGPIWDEMKKTHPELWDKYE